MVKERLVGMQSEISKYANRVNEIAVFCEKELGQLSQNIYLI